MNLTTSFTDRIQGVFQPTPRGVVGLVDDLLMLCRDQPLQLDFQDGYCHVRTLGVVSHDAVDVPLQKSVFRAVLARIAALCNERRPNSVTPYRGEGEVSIRTDPPAAFHVTFTNTPAEQRLEVRHATSSTGEANGKRGNGDITRGSETE
jgi:hypothetical protein